MRVERIVRSAAGLAVLCCAAAGAAEQEARPVVVIGASTEAILKMQREGTSAGQPQPMSGEVASRSYKRYLDSFNRPIPTESAPATTATAKPAAPPAATTR